MEIRMVAGLLLDATECAVSGDLLLARVLYRQQLSLATETSHQQLLINNLAAVEAALGNSREAIELLEQLRGGVEASSVAEHNWRVLHSRREASSFRASAGGSSSQRIAILSLLFNWPSTGGGTVHTQELAAFLSRIGFEVRHLYAQYEPWGLGQVTQPLDYPSTPLSFFDQDWNQEAIRARFREELQRFDPDWVIVTDSWNSKVLLAEAAEGYRTLIRIAAQESLCPLNNVRLLVDPTGRVCQCDRNQLSDPEECRSCVRQYGERLSGSLHQAERQLVGFGTPEYSQRLQRAFSRAEGVLAVNPEIADSFRPHVRSVHVVPSGFDVDRFAPVVPPPDLEGRKLRILFAGLMQEFMKGFHVLRAAGRLLWDQRQDFEIWATGELQEPAEPWLKCLGWQSQEQLPALISACDLLVFPTIAQEALGRTAVEAMGCGRPVVASRIGGLPWVVDEDVTGLLAAPGDPRDLANQCGRLLDDAELRARLGRAGREKFEREFTWEAIWERGYQPLLGTPVRTAMS